MAVLEVLISREDEQAGCGKASQCKLIWICVYATLFFVGYTRMSQFAYNSSDVFRSSPYWKTLRAEEDRAWREQESMPSGARR